MMKTKALLTISIVLVLIVILATVGVLVCARGNNHCWFRHAYNDTGKCTRCGDELPKENKPEEKHPLSMQISHKTITCEFVEGADAQTYRINVMLNNAVGNETITFTSSNLSVATVDEYGLLTIVGVGEATVTVTCDDLSAECAVKVSAQVQEGENL